MQSYDQTIAANYLIFRSYDDLPAGRPHSPAADAKSTPPPPQFPMSCCLLNKGASELSQDGSLLSPGQMQKGDHIYRADQCERKQTKPKENLQTNKIISLVTLRVNYSQALILLLITNPITLQPTTKKLLVVAGFKYSFFVGPNHVHE